MKWLSDLSQNIVFQTVISGVLVFVIGEIFQNVVLKPFQKYREVIGKIDNKLKFYSNVTANPNNTWSRDTYLECGKILRELSCDLESSYKQLIFKSKPKNMSEVAHLLIGLSNSFGELGDPLRNHHDETRIRQLLNIPEL